MIITPGAIGLIGFGAALGWVLIFKTGEDGLSKYTARTFLSEADALANYKDFVVEDVENFERPQTYSVRSGATVPLQNNAKSYKILVGKDLQFITNRKYKKGERVGNLDGIY